MILPDVSEMEAYIVQAAQAAGIDPQIALKVAKSEGLKEGVWQSEVVKDGVREPSYGPFQLYMGGGLGNRFESKYGVSPADPRTWKQQIDFALAEAKKGGWSPWYGARNAGIGNYEGLRNVQAPQAPQKPPVGPVEGLGSNAGPEAPYSLPEAALSPSQGPGAAVDPTLGEQVTGAVDTIDWAALSNELMQPTAPEIIPTEGPPQKRAPMEVEQTRYLREQGYSPMGILKQLGLM